MERMKPCDAAKRVTDFPKAGLEDVDHWVITATVPELQEFMHYARTPQWLERAQAALEIRLSAQAEQSANKLVQHTEKLTEQTNIHIQHSEKLTQQTDILVSESKNLNEQNKILVTESKSLGKLTKWIVGLTVGLLVLTVGLLALTAGLLYIDWHKEQAMPQPDAVWYPTSQILTNLDSPIIKLDAVPIAGSLTIKAQCPTNPAIMLSFTPDYYISNDCIVLPNRHFQQWHCLLQTTSIQMRIYISYASNIRKQK